MDFTCGTTLIRFQLCICNRRKYSFITLYRKNNPEAKEKRNKIYFLAKQIDACIHSAHAKAFKWHCHFHFFSRQVTIYESLQASWVKCWFYKFFLSASWHIQRERETEIGAVSNAIFWLNAHLVWIPWLFDTS